MGLESSVSLIVASLDLELVRLVRGAIRTADLSAGGRCDAATPLGSAPNSEPPRRFHPEPVVEPRRRICPAPRVEFRPVVQTIPPVRRVEALADDAAAAALPAPPPATPYCPCPSPIQPPWKVLPWQNPPAPRPVIKVVIRRPDIVRRGQFIDCFI